MPRKQVPMSAKPAEKPATVDDWVATPRSAQEPITPPTASESTPPQPIKMKRLTLDIPEELHRAIKTEAVRQGVAMVDMLRQDLTQKYGNTEK